MLGGNSVVFGGGVSFGSGLGPQVVGHNIFRLEGSVNVNGFSVSSIDGIISLLVFVLPLVALCGVLLENITEVVFGYSFGNLLTCALGLDSTESIIRGEVWAVNFDWV